MNNDSFRVYRPPILKNGNFSYKPVLRLIIEKRKLIQDAPGLEGVFIMEGEGLTRVTTSTSINGNPDQAQVIFSLSTLAYYQEYDKEKKNRLIIPNRDLGNSQTVLTNLKDNVFKNVNLDQPKVLDSKDLSSINERVDQLEAGDLIYVDAWSWRKKKMLPVFTGTIVRKRLTESLQDTRYLELDCEDLLYFLKHSRYITAPSVFGEAFNQTLQTDTQQKTPELNPFNSNLMGLSGFETFLKILLTNGSSEDLESYLDDQGRLIPKTAALPLRSPVTSRVERILAFPYTISMGQRWQLIQSENKSKLDLLKETASTLEVEFFQSEAGEIVFKYPTRLDGFPIAGMPAVNLLPRNNLGRSRAVSIEGKLIDQYIDTISQQKTIAGQAKLGVLKNPKLFQVKNIKDDPDYIYVDPNSEYQKINSIKDEVAKGGEIPTIYDDELQGSSFEENTEAVVTAGVVKIDQNFVGNNLSVEQATVTNQAVFFRDVVNSLKYGIRFQEFNPLWLRDQRFMELYAWMKMSVINQERFRASMQVLDDPFIRKGHSVKIDKMRKIKLLRLFPKKPTDVVEFSKDKVLVNGLQSGNALENASLVITNFNAPSKVNSDQVATVEFEEVLVNAPCIYYIEAISRSYNYGEGSPSMTLDGTAGRAEYNTSRKEGKTHYGEAEDQWTRGFFTFWEFFYEPPELSNARDRDVNLNKDNSTPEHQTPSASAPAAPKTPAKTNSNNILPSQKKLNQLADKIKSEWGQWSHNEHIMRANLNPILASISGIYQNEKKREGQDGTRGILARIDTFVQNPDFWKIVNQHVTTTSLNFTIDNLAATFVQFYNITTVGVPAEQQLVYQIRKLLDNLFLPKYKLKLNSLLDPIPSASELTGAEKKMILERFNAWTSIINTHYKTFFSAGG